MSGVAMEQALFDYLVEVHGGVLGEEYAQPQGRITLVDTFADVDKDSWYMDAYNYTFSNGIMTGTSDVTWAPELEVSRATVLVTLYRIAGSPAVTGDNFSDVVETDWFCNGALWGKNNGLTDGVDGALNGNEVITRTEMASIFVRYLELCGHELELADLSQYADADDIADWAVEQEVMTKIVGTGIIKGRGDTELAPNEMALRREFAQMLLNMKNFIESLDYAVGRVADLIYGGNLQLAITGKDLFNQGFAIGDIVTVRIGDLELDMPICANYNDVDVMDNLVRVPGGLATREVIVAINMSAFALKYSGAVGDAVFFTMKEQGGYLEELESRPAETGRTNNRDDYDSDEVFANFREVTLGGFAPGIFYRSSSPVDPGLGRAAYVDKFLADVGIATVINLANTAAQVEGFIAAEGFDSPYYLGLFEAGQVIPLGMGVDFFYDEANRDKLKEGLEFILDNDGPYLIHCTEGKDRVGFTAALLEALMGATIDEIKDDYMLTYVNYFHFEKGSADYEKFAEFAILPLMCLMAGVDKGTDLSTIDLVEAAFEYLIGIGLEKDQIDELMAVLAGVRPLALVA